VCEPNRGSEADVGWKWATHAVALGHCVSVLTRTPSEPVITAYFQQHRRPDNLRFIYVPEIEALKSPLFGGAAIYLQNLIWQWRAYRVAARAHAREPFEQVHHVTFAGIRQPSFLWRLGVPLVFGPVGGGERAPWPLRAGYGARGLLVDGLRDLSTLLLRWDPLMRATFRGASRIYVTSEATLNVLPAAHRAKTRVELAIAAPGIARLASRAPAPANDAPKHGLRILYAGRFLYWKGMALGLRAFAALLNVVPGATLTLIGDGPEKKQWQRLAKRLGIADRVEWLGPIPQDRLYLLYRQCDVLLFPSLHDAGGLVVLEAMSSGLPVVCFDIGGPGMLVDQECGRVIRSKGITAAGAASALCDALLEMRSPELRAALGRAGIEKAARFAWSDKVANIIADVPHNGPRRDVGPTAARVAAQRAGGPRRSTGINALPEHGDQANARDAAYSEPEARR
jgi:glycosyltransferase involved in cell wall biosynthesis